STPALGLHLMASIKTKIALAVLLAGGLASPLIIQRTAMNRLRVENETLRAQLSATQAIQLSPQTNTADSTEATRIGSQEAELLRLRGEVTRLRADAARTPQQSIAPANTRSRSTSADAVGGYEMYTGDLLGPHHADTIKMMKMVGLALRRLEQDSAISADVRAMPF